MKTFDFVHEEDGQLVGWEICLSGTADWNAEQAIKGAESVGIQELRLVCLDVKTEEALLDAIRRKDPHGIYSDRIKVWLVADLF